MPTKRHERHLEPARLAWEKLAERAASGETIAYSRLEDDIGWREARQAIRPVLDLIADYCQSEGLPDITILVVSKRTGRPSYTTVEDVDKETQRVLAVEWLKVPPPSAEALHKFL